MKTHVSLLAAVVASIVAPGVSLAAPEPFRLDRIAIVRFSAVDNERLVESQGLLDVEGNITWRSQDVIARPADLPEWALERTLVRREAWVAYYALAPGVLANFSLDSSVTPVTIGQGECRPVAVAANAQRDRGRMVNISTRARINAGDTPVIAGFVVEGHRRTFLVRAIGPTLATLGVPNAAPDPLLRVYRGNEVVFYNDNWGVHWGADVTRATTERVGAFPLLEDSRDAAVVLTLEPGAYTINVEPAAASATGGTILVEVYEVPLA